MRFSPSRRVLPYSILALVSVSLALVPCVLWPDFVASYPDCTVIERAPTRIVLQCTLTAPLPPDYLAGEIRLFKVLVSPTVAPSLLGVWRPEYTRFAFPDGIITEAVAMLHPLRTRRSVHPGSRSLLGSFWASSPMNSASRYFAPPIAIKATAALPAPA